MGQKTKTLENNTYFTKIVESTEIDGTQVQNTIYPLSLQGVKELTKNIAESELVDVEYLTVNSFTDYTREQLKDKKYIQLTNTAELEDIFKVKKGEPVKPKFIFCFLNKTKEETGKKAEKKREKESKTEENIPEHHFLPIILFNGKKYIFDLDLRKIEDSEFVKKIITQDISNSDFNNAIKDLESLHFIDNIKDDDKKIIDKINTFKTTLNSLFSTNIVNFIQDETKKQTITDNIEKIKEISKNLNIENFKDTKEKICKLTAEIDKIVLPHIQTELSEKNIEIFNVSQAMANGIYTGSIIQADEYNCGTNTVEVAQQIYEHYLKYFHYKEYNKIYREKYNKEYTKKSIPENERIDKFENYLQKEIKLDGKFVLLSQSSGTINKYLQKLHENIKNQQNAKQEKWMKYVKKLRQINILCGTLETEKEELFGKLSSEETESGKQAEKQIGKLKEQQQKEAQETKQSLQKEINELKQQHRKYFSIRNLEILQNSIDKNIKSVYNTIFKNIKTEENYNKEIYEYSTPLKTIHGIRSRHEDLLLKDDTQVKKPHSFQK